MRSIALSTCSVLTGRFAQRQVHRTSSLARSNSMRRPSLLDDGRKVDVRALVGRF